MSLELLKEEMPYNWKVQTAKEWGCECVAYIDARQVMDALDQAVGPGGWQDTYREISGQLYCDLSIKIDGEWVTKSDCGTAGNFEKEKAQTSDAFKRAAVKWGVGRFLYALDTVRVKAVESGKDKKGYTRYAPADDRGKRIYNLTAHINALQKPQPKTVTPAQREEIKKLCKDIGLKGVELNQYLKSKKMTWKSLTPTQAKAVISDLKKQKTESPAPQGKEAAPVATPEQKKYFTQLTKFKKDIKGAAWASYYELCLDRKPSSPLTTEEMKTVIECLTLELITDGLQAKGVENHTLWINDALGTEIAGYLELDEKQTIKVLKLIYK